MGLTADILLDFLLDTSPKPCVEVFIRFATNIVCSAQGLKTATAAFSFGACGRWARTWTPSWQTVSRPSGAHLFARP